MLRLLLPLAAVLLAACATPADRLRHVEVAACADKEAAGCEAARAGFQRLSYDSLDADKLTVAAARALGDLNFEVERDDARHQAAGAYVDSAPVHDKQLDSLFRGTLKPYQPAVISARVEVLLRRRGPAAEATVLRVDDLELDLVARTARRGGQVLNLLPTEFKLLEVMMRNSGQVLTRMMLFEAVWDFHFDPGTNVVNVHMSRLRRKVDPAGKPALIRTVRGSGYIIEPHQP